MGGYELDAVTLEYDDASDALDFRLELGSGMSILWALAAAPHDRLRLVLVDGAAFSVAEPELWEDPFVGELPRLEWPGDARPLGPGRTLRRLALELSAQPPRYRCEVAVTHDDGREVLHVFAWQVASA